MQTVLTQAVVPVAAKKINEGGAAKFLLTYLLATDSASDMPPDLPEPTREDRMWVSYDE